VHLGKDKVLHIGPRQEGKISTHDVDRAGVQHLLAEEAIEISGDRQGHAGHDDDGTPVQTDTHGHHPDLTVRKRGER
jgi:hypothetical protein